MSYQHWNILMRTCDAERLAPSSYTKSGMDQIEIRPLLHRLAASIRVPSSKSITNLTLLMAALSEKLSVIESALVSDTLYMIGALRHLGYQITLEDHASRIIMQGQGGIIIPVSSADLFVGGSDTAMSFLAGFLTLGKGCFRLDGNARMRQRPIGNLIGGLRRLGLSIHLGLRIPGIRINNPSCVSKTYPHFFVDLAALG